jgi:hypothetical protein
MREANGKRPQARKPANTSARDIEPIRDASMTHDRRTAWQFATWIA